MKIAATSADVADLRAFVGHLYAIDDTVRLNELIVTPATPTTHASIEVDIDFPNTAVRAMLADLAQAAGQAQVARDLTQEPPT